MNLSRRGILIAGGGAAVVGDAIHVAGGGPMNGGAFQASVHEVFRI
jgi:hypothetical protein